MKDIELFKENFYWDDTSPTMFRNKKDKGPNARIDHPAGTNGKYPQLCATDDKDRVVHWSLPRTIYELSYGVDLTKHDFIKYKDGNEKNFHPANLMIVNRSVIRPTETVKMVWNEKANRYDIRFRFSKSARTKEEAQRIVNAANNFLDVIMGN